MLIIELMQRLRLEAEREVTDLSERKLALATEVARLEATIHIQNANAHRNSQNAEQVTNRKEMNQLDGDFGASIITLSLHVADGS